MLKTVCQITTVFLFMLLASCGGGGGGSSSTPTYTIGYTAYGVQSTGLILTNTSTSESKGVTSSGSGTFSNTVSQGGSYNVTVFTSPIGYTCSVSNGSGSNVTANVTNVTINCSVDTYSVNGTVSGLGAGKSVVITDNGADTSTITANGSFTFPTKLAYGTNWTVAVATQPVGQTCTLSANSGFAISGNVFFGLSCL
jgi:hypothetical protein